MSVYALAEVEDLNRLFRQVHRVMSPGAPLVVSMPHPTYVLVGEGGGEPPALTRSYFDPAPLPGRRDGAGDHPHALSGVFTSLSRAKFGVDTLLEPEAEPGPPGTPPPSTWQAAMAWLPPTLVLRARKLGV